MNDSEPTVLKSINRFIRKTSDEFPVDQVKILRKKLRDLAHQLDGDDRCIACGKWILVADENYLLWEEGKTCAKCNEPENES